MGEKQESSKILCPRFYSCNAPIDDGWQHTICINNWQGCRFLKQKREKLEKGLLKK